MTAHSIANGDAEALVKSNSGATTVQLARLMSVDAGNIDSREGSITALGLDSIVAVELRNRVARQLDAPLQSTEILTNQTMQELAEKIALRSKKVGSVTA